MLEACGGANSSMGLSFGGDGDVSRQRQVMASADDVRNRGAAAELRASWEQGSILGSAWAIDGWAQRVKSSSMARGCTVVTKFLINRTCRYSVFG